MMIPERKQNHQVLQNTNPIGPDLQMLQLQTGYTLLMNLVQHMDSLIRDRIPESYLCFQSHVRGNYAPLLRRISHVL